MKRLALSFYQRNDVTQIAKDLLGKLVVTRFDGCETIARIVETEAYNGVVDKASHAYGERRTTRTAVMYENGGVAYVYLCYGIHHLFNIVTSEANVPHAVLIRALEPVAGIDYMLRRRNKQQADFSVTRGPGSAAQAMGISTAHTGISLKSDTLYLAEDGYEVTAETIIATPRIGVDYAGEDAMLPYRFFIGRNQYVSGKSSFNYR